MFGHVALVTVDRLLNIAVDAEGIPANYVGLFVRTGAARLPGESVCGIGLQLQCCTPMPPISLELSTAAYSNPRR
jgi:hypothetical protein